MRLRFLGATSTVTGSRFLVESKEAAVLVDCGLFQGFKPLRLRNWAPFPVEPAAIDAVILTHAHLDHSGYLPLLVKNGFRGPIYSSRATHELCAILLPDSAHLQEEQAAHANRFGYSKHAPALPLYTHADAEKALRRFEPVDFEREWRAAGGLDARLSPAGHILGASIVTLACEGRTVVFTGDLGRPADCLMRAPTRVEHADALVLESTYGDRAHAPGDPFEKLGRIVAATAARGGVVVIPSFAVGRAQALLHGLERLKAAGAIPRSLPIYLDSPMATDVTALYARHQDEHHLDRAAFQAMCRAAKFVATPEESRRLDESTWPMVIVAGSGMAAGGRVLHHLKRFAPDPRNTVLFAGFQAGGTRGAALVQGAREVKIHGAYVPVRAAVENLESLSAHADATEILAWLSAFKSAPRRIFLVHGEPTAADTLRRRVSERFGWACEIPEYRDAVKLGAHAR